MGKLTDKQKQFLQKHNMWDPKKGKSKLGFFEEWNFQDFFERKEKVEMELARLPDEVTKQNLMLRLQAAENKAKDKKFKEAYKDLEQVKLEAGQAAESYVNALSPDKLGNEIKAWRQEGQNLDTLVTQWDSAMQTTRSELANLGNPAAFASGSEADQFLNTFQTTENLLRSNIADMQNAGNLATSYLAKNDPAVKLKNLGHQLSILRKEKNADVADLDLRLESAHVFFIHKGKTLTAGGVQTSIDELALEVNQTIDARKSLAEGFANQAYWNERSVTVGDRMVTVLKTGPVERIRIEGLWAFANARAEKGGAADYKAAVTTLADLTKLLDTATPEVRGAEGGVEKTGEALVQARELQSAQVVWQGNVDAAKEALKRIRAEFQPALPAALNVQALKLDGLVAPITETDPVKVRTLAASVAEETRKLDELAVAPRTERATWKQTLAAFELQLASLTNHPQKDEATKVKPLIDKIKEDLEKAKLDATAMKWSEGTAAVRLLGPRCETAMQTADGLSHFNTIRTERQTRINTLPTTVIAQEQARLAVEATRKLLTDADSEKNAGKYAEAIVLLNKIPDAVASTLLLVQKAKGYAAELLRYEGYVTELGLFTGDAQAAIATGLANFTQRVAAAKFEQTSDYVTSMTMLGQTLGQYNGLKAKAQQAKAYKEALDAFALRFTAVEDHEGRIAIEEFYVRMQNDRTFANTRKLAGEPHVGTTILTATQPLHAAQIALADKAKSYMEKYEQAEEAVAELEKKGNAGKAAQGIAEAKTRMAAAVTAASGKDWDGALKTIAEAEAAIAAATTLLNEDKTLGDLKDTGKLDAIATDFSAAFGVFEAMRNQAKGKDPSNTFATQWAKANDAAQRAKAASLLSPPNFVLARTELDAAIAECETTLAMAVKKKPFDDALVPLKTAHTTTLPGLNEDNCISTNITAIGQAITRAENLAKTPTFNFDGAQQEIGVTWPKVREAERNAKAFKAMKPDRETIKNAITFLEQPARSAGVATEIQKLKDAQTSIANDITANKHPDAAKTAAATAKLCPGFRAVGTAYEDAVAKRRDWVVSRLPQIEGVGKEAADAELKSAKAMNAEIQTLMDNHIYSAVKKRAGDAYWVIQAGIAIVTASGPYEPARSLAETSLTNALPNRTPATEETYDALRERYDAAVELVKNERNYTRATSMLNTIPGECNNLTTPANNYRAYETSRQNAGKKLGDAMKDKNAAAIRPLLTQLQGRHAAAVKIAAGDDYAGAKKLLDAIITDAEKALLAATDARNYATAAEDIKKPGTGIDEAYNKARTLYDDLMAMEEALYAVSTLAGINKTLKSANEQKATNVEGARTLLGQVIDACAKARILMSHYEQMESQMKALGTEMTTFLNTHAQKEFVKPAVDKLREDIEGARREARGTGDYVKATKQIQIIDTAFIAQRRAADAQVKYVARKTEVETELGKMDEHDSRYSIVAEIAAVRDDLSKAADKATAHDHPAAMALLEAAATKAEDALLKAKMHKEDVAPTAAEVKKILDGKDGAKRLDEIVATLDPKSARKIMDVAFEVRFGCQLQRFASKANEGTNTLDTDKSGKAPDIRRFYGLMSKLPDTHTKDNDSMQIFAQVGGPATGSDYGGSTKKVGMREGDVDTSSVYGIALPHEIDEVEPGCELNKGEPITYFNWNTVHEVGHAVDDKLGFMKGKGKSYANWTEYGGNVTPIAAAVAGKYNFDAKYIAAYMIKASAVGAAKAAHTADSANVAKRNALTAAEAEAKIAADTIPAPVGCEPAEWERRRVACIGWVDSARAGNNPWNSSSTAKALAIGGVVYQESYDSGSWSSYNLSARKQGVTGYQFRAPGEWFSELYAAFHTKKLKPSHPAYAWLQDL